MNHELDDELKKVQLEKEKIKLRFLKAGEKLIPTSASPKKLKKDKPSVLQQEWVEHAGKITLLTVLLGIVLTIVIGYAG